MNAIVGENQSQSGEAFCRHAERAHFDIKMQAVFHIFILFDVPLALQQIGDCPVAGNMRHFRVINLFVEVDVRIHAESPDGIKHGIETDFGSKAACHYDSACIDHRVVGGTVRIFQFHQRVKWIAGRLHAYFFKDLVEAADFQCDCQSNDFGDTLNAETDFRIPDGNPFAVPAKNTDSELTAIYLSKFWYVGGNCTLMGMCFSQCNGLFKYISHT